MSKAPIVLCTGTFNLLHSGHCRLFEFASRYGSLTVGLNTDPYLVGKYGDKAIPLLNRAYCVGSNRFVDRVVSFDEPDPSNLIRKLKPRYYIKGPDYVGQHLAEMEAILETGTELVLHRETKECSSSDYLELINSSLLKAIRP